MSGSCHLYIAMTVTLAAFLALCAISSTQAFYEYSKPIVMLQTKSKLFFFLIKREIKLSESVVNVILIAVAMVTDYLSDNCSPDPEDWVIYLGWDRESTYGVVQLVRVGDYWTGMNCALKLVPPAGYNLNIVVDWVDIYQAAPNTCGPDYLYIKNNYTTRESSYNFFTLI